MYNERDRKKIQISLTSKTSISQQKNQLNNKKNNTTYARPSWDIFNNKNNHKKQRKDSLTKLPLLKIHV